MNEALDLNLDTCALVRMKIRNPQELEGGGGCESEDVNLNICQSHTVVKQVVEGNFYMWDSNYFDGNSHLAAAGVNSQLQPLGRCSVEALSLVQSLTIQNQNSSRWKRFPQTAEQQTRERF